jgi:hypothetical protein
LSLALLALQPICQDIFQDLKMEGFNCQENDLAICATIDFLGSPHIPLSPLEGHLLQIEPPQRPVSLTRC